MNAYRKQIVSNPSLVPQFSSQSSSGGLISSSIQRATQRELEVTVGQALVARTQERAREALASEALEATGSLTALETHLIQIAPLGEARYKAIVDSFVLGAATTIARL